MTKTFEERKQALWARLERKNGLPFNEKFRDKMEQRYADHGAEVDLQDLKGGVEDFIQLWRVRSYLPATRTPRHPPQKKYQRPFRKRVYLVNFVINHQLQASVRKRTLDLRRRINWKTTCEAWNKAHPHDPMTPSVIKATYYRAVVDNDVHNAPVSKLLDDCFSLFDDPTTLLFLYSSPKEVKEKALGVILKLIKELERLSENNVDCSREAQNER